MKKLIMYLPYRVRKRLMLIQLLHTANRVIARQGTRLLMPEIRKEYRLNDLPYVIGRKAKRICQELVRSRYWRKRERVF